MNGNKGAAKNSDPAPIATGTPVASAAAAAHPIKGPPPSVTSPSPPEPLSATRKRKRRRRRGYLSSLAMRMGKEMGLVRPTRAPAKEPSAAQPTGGANGFSLKEAVIYGDDGEESIDFVRL